MNEITLNALINLFALFSAISESKKEEATRNFSLYLHQHFGIADANDYLRLFEELLDLYDTEGEQATPDEMVLEAFKISTNLKSLLRKEEQVMVFLRFLELIKDGNQSKARLLTETLSSVFEINETQVSTFISFINYSDKSQVDHADFLLINRDIKTGRNNLRHIYEKNLDGEMIFMRCPLFGHYIFIFRGDDYLTVEGNPVIPGRFYAFKEGSIIRGPRIAPVYYTDIASGFVDKLIAPPFEFSGEEIEFKFRNSPNGLYRFSFAEKSGQLIAIMGGSGVGKSTLLNILNGNIPVHHGRIRINQVDVFQRKNEIEGLIGYVPQDDLLFEDLTVWENLYYNASLCFDHLTDSDLEKKVTHILHELELYPIRNLKAGSPLNKTISGGQRKRLNVALELLREPAILFVDEPTSGLSSTDSEKVMLLLKQQSRKGKLIIVNIHQPSSAIFKLFDKLWILDSGGRPIYTGNPLDGIIYFKKEVNHVNAEMCECPACGNVNPEQVLEIIETKKIDHSGNFLPERRFSPEYWYEQYLFNTREQKEESRDLPGTLPAVESKKPGILKQFRIFSERNLMTKITDRQYLYINLLVAPVLALVVAWFTRYAEGEKYIFFENKSLISYLFMSVVVLLFLGMSVSAEEIIKDRKILQREAFLNLSRFSYLNSKIVFLLLLSAVQSLTFVLIGNLILGIHHMLPAYWMILFSVAVFSNLLGMNISSAFDSVVVIYIMIPLLLIPQILLCGVIVKFDDLRSHSKGKDPVPFAGEIMVSRWAFEALAVQQFKANHYMARFFDMEKEMAQSLFRSDIVTTELNGQIDLVDGWSRLSKPAEDISFKLQVIRNEIIKLDKENHLPEFEHINELYPGRFDPNIAGLAKTHLQQLKEFHQKRYENTKQLKDQLINKINTEKGNRHLIDQKMKYHNKSLETLVLNSETKPFFRETPYGYVQKIAPIYKDPDFNFGRAHFLASEKRLLGNLYGTPGFNLVVIWLMSAFLYVALYFDWLRKLIHFPAHFKTIKSFIANGKRKN
ncbi:MAG: ATP-binding cassette domain-containing protein [Bacteroidota bacterium]